MRHPQRPALVPGPVVSSLPTAHCPLPAFRRDLLSERLISKCEKECFKEALRGNMYIVCIMCIHTTNNNKRRAHSSLWGMATDI